MKTGLHHRWEIEREGSAGYPLEPEDVARMVLFILEEPGRKHGEEVPETPVATERAGDLTITEFPADVAKEPVTGPGAPGGWEFEDEDDTEEGFTQEQV